MGGHTNPVSSLWKYVLCVRHTLWSCGVHLWAILHTCEYAAPCKLRCILLIYAAPFWTTLHPLELCCTPLSWVAPFRSTSCPQSQCCGSMTFWCGSGSRSADPWLWLIDPNPDSDPNRDPDPAIFIIDIQDANKKLIKKKCFSAYYFLKVHLLTYFSVWRIWDVYHGSRILIFTHPGSRISDLESRILDLKTATKVRGEKKIFVKHFFVATNFTKCKNIIFLNYSRKKFGPNFKELWKFFKDKKSKSSHKTVPSKRVISSLVYNFVTKQ